MSYNLPLFVLSRFYFIPLKTPLNTKIRPFLQRPSQSGTYRTPNQCPLHLSCMISFLETRARSRLGIMMEIDFRLCLLRTSISAGKKCH